MTKVSKNQKSDKKYYCRSFAKSN